MTHAQRVATHVGELIETGKILDLSDYLADDVIASSLHGVVYGKDKVIAYLLDDRRYMHHGHSFNRWKQVHHCLDPALRNFSKERGTGAVARTTSSRRIDGLMGFRKDGDDSVAQFYDGEGYDSQGFAQFEREGKIGSHPQLTWYWVRVRQTVALSNGLVKLIGWTKTL